MKIQMRLNVLIVTLIFLVTLSTNCYSQKVTNIQFEFDKKNIVIYYDLNGSDLQAYWVSVYLSEDEGKIIIPLKKVSGDVGDSIRTGTRKKIIWERDAEKLSIQPKLNFQVSAEPDLFFDAQSGFFTDKRDGIEYKWIRINKQIWMAENLNAGYYTQSNVSQSDNGITEKYCYNDNILNCTTYGGLYKWDEMMQNSQSPGTQGICPENWHLPQDWEWAQMIFYLGGKVVSYGRIKEVGTRHWKISTKGVNNVSRFTALPGGLSTADTTIVFNGQGKQANFWSSTERSPARAAAVGMGDQLIEVYFFNGLKEEGYSVRCVRD